MGPKSNRNKPPRSRNPLLVSASAITRAIDPTEPSRVTVLRLLGDALHTFQESQLVVDQIKSRTVTYTSRNAPPPSRPQLEADSRVRQAHEQGARALFTAATSALIKLPARAGPLRRRAVDLLTAAGKAAGPAVVMQAAENCRSHISALKRLTWSDTERGDFEVVCAILTLADISNCAIAGRDIAKNSVHFLLGQKVKHKCRRGDLAYSIAMVVQSFPVHAPPDDRMVDALLDFALSPSAIKHGDCGVGSALLVAIIVPLLVSRGSQPADDVALSCGRAMKAAPIATERAMWAVAMARASVTARRSMTYQLKKYGNLEAGAKSTKAKSSHGRLPQKFEKDPDDTNASAWVSNDIFETALFHVADTAGLEDGRVDGTIAVASVLRMWAQALPDSDAEIMPRIFAKLLSRLSTVSAVSALVDAVWLGLLKDLKPSRSPIILEKLLPFLAERDDQSDLRVSAALHICSTILFRFGRQCIRETGLTAEYGAASTMLIKHAHEVLDASSRFVRAGGVGLMCALVMALPRACSQLVTALLQNLRIAELTLATREPSSIGVRTFAGLTFIEREMSSILGNSLALSALIRKVTSGDLSVPSALIRQCKVDSLALLRSHKANTTAEGHGFISNCIRRRVGWGLIAALACAKQKDIFEGETFAELLLSWKSELGFVGEKGERNIGPRGNPESLPDSTRPELSDEQKFVHMDELLAISSTRSAALYALLCALQNTSSQQLLQCSKALLGACAARIIATQAMYGTPSSQGVLWGGTGWVGDTSDTSVEKRRNLARLARLMAVESVYLLQCITVVPPRGDVAELCYFIALSLGEEAERVGGESEIGSATDTAQSNNTTYPERISQVEATMSNQKHRLAKLMAYPFNSKDFSCNLSHGKQNPRVFDSRRSKDEKGADTSWIFSMQGVRPLLAEEVLFHSAAAIAAIVSEDLSASGSLVESLSISKLGACFSAMVVLEMSRRLSRSDLAEINRCLALLQVLARRSLKVTGGCLKTISSESRDGRLFVPQLRGDSINFEYNDIPGVALQRLGRSEGWTQWARKFTNDGLVARVPFHDFHLRALGMMHASRSIAAEAHRELGITGGPRLWVGMMRRIVTIIKENMDSISPSQTVMLSNGLAALGALLEVIPDSFHSLKGISNENDINMNADLSVDIDEIGSEAINVLVDVIEKGNIDAREAAALALSNCSHRIAVSSERLLGALLKAWTDERGEFSKMGYFGRSASEAEVWASCFAHIWRDMGVRSVDDSLRFFSNDSCGLGSCSASLVTGATAVLSSCRLHWWAVTESCYSTVMELSVELLQWTGHSCQMSRAAGLYGVTALWASRIDEVRVRHLMSSEDSVNSQAFTGAPLKRLTSATPLLPVQAFSLKDPSHFASAIGPFLDEILYGALAPKEISVFLGELQTAATAATTEIIRGAGGFVTCTHLPRLPEVLFAAVDDGSMEAGRLIMILARCDAQRRPRYWFGLCRAICLGGERLNYGASKSIWDVSSETKAFSVKVAAEAIDLSLASCECLNQIEKRQIGFSNHTCAYSFLRKIFEFVSEICEASTHDCRTCEEGCNMIRRIALRIGSVPSSLAVDSVLRECGDLWDSSLSRIEVLLTDSVPHTVVTSAASAVSELLVSFVRLCHYDLFGSAQGKVSTFLEKSVSSDIRRRFLYSDQGEEVGAQAILALIANYSKVVTCMQAMAQKRSNFTGGDVLPLLSVRNVLLAVIGDFVSILSADGLQMTATDGGALTSGIIPESQLEKLFFLQIPSIILGAVSYVWYEWEQNYKEARVFWANSNAAGAMMTKDYEKFSNVPIGCFVWLLKHEHEHTKALPKLISFGCQSQDALLNICCSTDNPKDHVKELIVSFAQWQRETFFEFMISLTALKHAAVAMVIFVVELAQDVLREAMIDGTVADFDANLSAICGGIAALGRSVGAISERDDVDMHALAGQVMDTMMTIIQIESDDAEDCYEDLRFQRAVCECVLSCIEILGNSRRISKVWIPRITEMFWDGYERESLPRMKAITAIGAAICELIEDGDVITEFSQLLLTPFSNDSGTHEKYLVLDAALECNGIEQFVIKVVTSRSSTESVNAKTSFAILYELGRSVLSTKPCCTSTVLQISIAAIRGDCGKNDIVNRVGLLLYSICLSKLVRSLPTSQQGYAEKQWEIAENAAFLLHLTARDVTLLRSMISLLGFEERGIVKSFLQLSESQKKTGLTHL